MLIQPRLALVPIRDKPLVFREIYRQTIPSVWVKVLVLPTSVSVEYVKALLLIQGLQVNKIIQRNACSTQTLLQLLEIKENPHAPVAVFFLEGTTVFGANTRDITLAYSEA